MSKQKPTKEMYNMKYSRVIATFAAVLAAVALTSGNSYASKDEGKKGSAEKTKVTLEEAVKIAKDKVPGEVIEVEYERGKRAYEVKIRTKDGVEKLYVDADEGTIRDRKDRDDKNTKGTTTDKK
ncbi:MAG: PepSY domain-containing protein [Deltaproteobacteria bacterium]|nr:PepSY domain-containing protein [Deltaproteobacteria bacterium]